MWPAPMPSLSLHTPLGPLTVSEEAGAIVALDWGWGRDQSDTDVLRAAVAQLHAYFDGARTLFNLPLAPSGSLYRRRVWAALQLIPYGETRSYAAVSDDVGGSPRSVGAANGANPIPIIIPCHRVVAANSIGGYSGGDGVASKRWLLALEKRVARADPAMRHRNAGASLQPSLKAPA